MSNPILQEIHLADNINAAILKINQNFEGLDSAVSNITINIDSADITNIINNVLDSDYFLTVIDSDYIQQLLLNMELNFDDSQVQANATNILELYNRIDITDSGVLVLASQIQQVEADLANLTLDGIDSAFLESAVAGAMSSLTARINVNSDGLTILGEAVDSVSASLVLIDSELGGLDGRITGNANAITTLTSRINVNSDSIDILGQSVDSIRTDLNNIVLDAIDSDLIIDAVAEAQNALSARITVNSDGITSLGSQITTLNANLSAINSDTNERIDLNASAISSVIARVNINSDELSAIAEATDSLSVSLDQILDENGNVIISPADVEAATADAFSQVYARIEADSARLTVMSGRVDSFQTELLATQGDLDAEILATGLARQQLENRISINSDTITNVSSLVTELDSTLLVRDAEGNVTSTAHAGAVEDLRTEVVAEDGLIQSALSSFETTIEAMIDSSRAAITTDYQTYVDNATGNTTASWRLNVEAGDTTDPYVAGIELSNNSQVADLVITADTFKLVTPTATDGSGGINPFTVDATGVKLSNATVTGSISIGTGLTGTDHMEITNDRIDIFEGNARRVRLGML